jgi:hypothetical protein
MRTILHILTQPQNPLAQQLVAEQQRKPENQVEVVDLQKKEPDYKKLLEKIFEADSVDVW